MSENALAQLIFSGITIIINLILLLLVENIDESVCDKWLISDNFTAYVVQSNVKTLYHSKLEPLSG